MEAEAWLAVGATVLAGLGGSWWGGRLSRAGAVEAVERQIAAGRRDSVIGDAVAWGADLVGAAYRIRTIAETIAAMSRQPIPISMGTVGRMLTELAEAQRDVMASRQRLRGLQLDALSSAADEIAEVVVSATQLMVRERWWEFLTFWRRDLRWVAITDDLTTAIAELESAIADLSSDEY